MPFDHEDLAQHFGRIWPVHVEQFTELLITLRRHFSGDLDRMLVLAIIGSRTLPRRRVEGLSYAEFAAFRRLDITPDPINVQSISDYSGIPRETVRRKVRDLEALGWVVKQDNGYLIASAKATQDLAPATEAAMQYLVAIGAACIDAKSGR